MVLEMGDNNHNILTMFSFDGTGLCGKETKIQCKEIINKSRPLHIELKLDMTFPFKKSHAL